MLKMQKSALAIGKTGCYFLSIVYLSSEVLKENNYVQGDVGEYTLNVSLFRLFRDAVQKGWCTEECFMLQPDKMMAALLGNGAKASVRHESVGYVPKAGEYEITRYEKGSFAHFVVTRNGKIVYDPYGHDEKDLGKAVSKRIFKVSF